MIDDSTFMAELPLLVITPRPPVTSGLAEAWGYRELLGFFVWRDVKVRYKQTVLGVLWAVLQPVGLMVVFSLFLGRLAHVPSDGAPYPLFVLCGLLLWQLFSSALAESSNSLVANERLITRVYFPRTIIPAAAVAGALVDFVISCVVLLALLAYYGIYPTITLLAAPLFVLLGILAAFGTGLWLSALTVQYRDVRYVLGFLMQFWMFITPVVYPGSLVPERWRALYGLNPMAGVIEGFRWSVLGSAPPSPTLLATSVLTIVLFIVTGLRYFQHMEQSFADVI